jgi:hypothetical protein
MPTLRYLSRPAPHRISDCCDKIDREVPNKKVSNRSELVVMRFNNVKRRQEYLKKMNEASSKKAKVAEAKTSPKRAKETEDSTEDSEDSNNPKKTTNPEDSDKILEKMNEASSKKAKVDGAEISPERAKETGDSSEDSEDSDHPTETQRWPRGQETHFGRFTTGIEGQQAQAGSPDIPDGDTQSECEYDSAWSGCGA